MKNTILFIAIAFSGSTGLAFAEEKMTMPMDHSAHMSKPAQIAISDAAKDAVATVDRFSAALAAGNLEAVGAELDPNVLVLESGNAEHSAAEYLASHAKGDAAFLKTVHVQLMRRSAQASGDMAWVASESEMHVQMDGKRITLLSTETMVLKRNGKTWKIIHIHWSSRTKKA